MADTYKPQPRDVDADAEGLLVYDVGAVGMQRAKPPTEFAEVGGFGLDTVVLVSRRLDATNPMRGTLPVGTPA